MKSLFSSLSVCCAAIALVVLAAGCQTPGELVSKETSDVCPHCTTETRTAPIKGLTYTRALCPTCHKVTTVSPTLRDAVRSYVGNDIGNDVHVCDKCEAIVEDCPVCQKKKLN